ncbi:ABC transporter permease [Paenibacillus apii]|nr:ABC transporter permease [Paenibacillus apii]
MLKRSILIISSLIIMIGFFYVLEGYQQSTASLYIKFDIKANAADKYQVFYSSEKNVWSEANSKIESYDAPGGWKTFEIKLPNAIYYIRLDLGNGLATDVEVRNLSFFAVSDARINLQKLDFESNQLRINELNKDHLKTQINGRDPYFYFNASPFTQSVYHGNIGNSFILALLSLLVGAIYYFVAGNAKRLYSFVRDLYRNKNLVYSLAKNDFKTKYASSYLGILWGFIQPLITILTYWFVFQVGLRSGNVGDVPFIVWFIAGIVPWFFFSEALIGATNVFSEYSYLVKKVLFRIELLPFVKIVSAGFVQLFFILFIFIVHGFYGYPPTFYNFQLIYYLICMIVLVTSITFLTSAVMLFFKDLNQIISVIVQIGFWFTPIGWPVSMLSDFWAKLFKLNPMYYIVQGYRDSFINQVLFFERPYETVYFWIFCFFMFTVGFKIFEKLKPHFSDVL